MNIIWKGSPNHFNGRFGRSVTHITLHIMAGFLAGTDATFAKAGGASTHFGVGADGTIHQWVSEADGSWSDSNFESNVSTISIEHEGGIPSAPCTDACIEASAQLCADIARRHGWSKLWHDGTNGNVWLHREVPGSDHTTCPDLAPNGLPVDRLIAKANEILSGKETKKQERKTKMAEMIFTNTDDGKSYYWNILTGVRYIGVPDQLEILKKAGVPECDTSAKAAWMTRAAELTDMTLTSTKAQLTAQSAALDAMSKAVGADPETIAETVRKAVEAKLESIQIKVTTE